MDYSTSVLKKDRNSQLKYSCSYTKGATTGFQGRSASFFRINAGYRINP